MTNNVHIIAEAGTNHGGKLSIAKKLVDVAVEANANSVKFQIIYPEGLYLPKFFQEGKYVDNEVFQKRAAGMLKDEEYRSVANYCQGKGTHFTASVFDSRGIKLVNELNVTYIKIASCDLNNSHLLKEASETGKKIIISTGMATLGEIEKAVSDVVSTGNTDIVLMHCVSVYPCPTSKMNLNFLNVLRQTFGFPIGLSDHTENSLASAIAVNMGVKWIEKHFTLDRCAEGFDHSYAMEPANFAQFIQDIRSAEQACTPQSIKIQEAEAHVKSRARRSLYAARDIQEGEKLTEKDVLIVRPEGSLKPNDLSLILGKCPKVSIHQYEALSLDLF